MSINATVIGQFITFVLFVLFCMKYIWPRIILAIENRQKEISESLANAKKIVSDAIVKQNNILKDIEKAKQEAKDIIKKANDEYISIIENAKTEARIESNKILSRARSMIENEFKCAHEELRLQIASLVISGIEKIINDSVTSSIDHNIINRFIDDLSKGKECYSRQFQ